MKYFALVLSVFFSLSALGKTDVAIPKKDRTPASEAIETVKANSLRQAWARVVKKNDKVKAILKKVNADYKECGGGITVSPNDGGKMVLHSGKGSATSRYVEYLVPFVNGCSGSGMIEEAALIARIGNDFVVGEDEGPSTYYFYGFVKVETRAIDSAEQGPGIR